MSISPVDPAAVAGAILPQPSTVNGKAVPATDPIVTTGVPAQAATIPTAGTAPVTDQQVSKAVDALNNSPAFRQTGLNFSTDKESGITVVKITDSKTDEVIRQIPSTEALALTHSIDATLRGNLINHKA
ncbi:MAG: flagellin [Herbaspirillum sp.]|jgi:flagellar protein FlaG|nr:flagellin [Herbaspirillum sp.]